MDILNFISWIRGGRVVNSVDPAKTLLPVGLKDNRRDDGYLAGAISVEDFTNQVKPYKVYTALLTQSGASGGVSVTSGPLIIGASYMIINNTGVDFTLVGAPNNDINTWFVATGSFSIVDWGNYGAELDYNSGAPVVTVLENTLGNIWFTYSSVGSYACNSDNLFIESRSMAIIGTPVETVTNNNFAGIISAGTSLFAIDVVETVPIDGLLYNTPIEIRVYN